MLFTPMINKVWPCALLALSRIAYCSDAGDAAAPPGVATLRDFQKYADDALENVQKHWKGELIITFLDGEKDNMEDTFRNLANLIYLRSAFKDEDPKILSLENRLRAVKKNPKFGDAAGEINGAFEEYYDFLVDSMQKLLRKYSCKLVDGFEFPKFKDIAVPGSGKLEKLLGVMSMEDEDVGEETDFYELVDADTMGGESKPFSIYMEEFMRLVLNKYREFSDEVDDALCKIDQLSLELKDLNAQIKELSEEPDDDETMQRLEAQKEEVESHIEEKKINVNSAIEQGDRSEYDDFLDERFYFSLEDKLRELFSEKMALDLILKPNYVSDLISYMMKNMLAFCKHIKAHFAHSSSFDMERLLDEDLSFVSVFKKENLKAFHDEIIDCGKAAEEAIRETLVDLVPEEST